MNGATVFEKSAQSVRVWTTGRAMIAVLLMAEAID
jgi:hypothetical protein